MIVKVKFNTQMMKNGQLREIGDEMEMDATSAVLLSKKGNVDILDYDVIQVEKTVIVDELIPKQK